MLPTWVGGVSCHWIYCVITTLSRVFPAQLGGTMAEWIWAVVCVTEFVVTLQNAFENTKHHI